ncbi:NUDIX domain-containing protein [Mesobacillus selenatarsenatis]|uniref:Mutator mutT protein (7,8-dihydro-8-oxoguanine-triphosphatase) n=1 Tax=Mesobacillus selenatarsenatis (strain DSM 18680 / JCM 14380 / FERM P-15431 / SF-1) TaxID=1321606 RepID=A0A0A8X6T6_MESS1|nr:NUDIX domain-containing protein [Mesobacillus selenatarsenatis]GAM14959.1 mutator mutT protein (7,8-dihydro-8-oxoguanine-triphosphatase) [Mesobacillus selenatarsenatis SF-1]
MITFGEIELGVSYTLRPGVYGIIFNEQKNLIALIETGDGKYFLPGGGLEGSESHKECLVREGIEEMGSLLEIGEWIGKAQRYFYSEKDSEYYLGEGYFYFAEIAGEAGEPVEADHQLRWVETGAAVKMLFHEHQSWALQKALVLIEKNEEI